MWLTTFIPRRNGIITLPYLSLLSVVAVWRLGKSYGHSAPLCNPVLDLLPNEQTYPTMFVWDWFLNGCTRKCICASGISTLRILKLSWYCTAKSASHTHALDMQSVPSPNRDRQGKNTIASRASISGSLLTAEVHAQSSHFGLSQSRSATDSHWNASHTASRPHHRYPYSIPLPLHPSSSNICFASFAVLSLNPPWMRSSTWAVPFRILLVIPPDGRLKAISPLPPVSCL